MENNNNYNNLEYERILCRELLIFKCKSKRVLSA